MQESFTAAKTYGKACETGKVHRRGRRKEGRVGETDGAMTALSPPRKRLW